MKTLQKHKLNAIFIYKLDEKLSNHEAHSTKISRLHLPVRDVHTVRINNYYHANVHKIMD